jgi:hypothetical protein
MVDERVAERRVCALQARFGERSLTSVKIDVVVEAPPHDPRVRMLDV